MAEKHFIAIGAEWCGYSKKQEDVVNDVADKTQNVHMLMCQGADDTLKEEWQKKACAQALESISGFPTWFEKEGPIDGDGAVTPIEHKVSDTKSHGLHYLDSAQICSELDGACK